MQTFHIVLIENCFQARRPFIDAARVRENWFSLTLIPAAGWQTGPKVSNGKFQSDLSGLIPETGDSIR